MTNERCIYCKKHYVKYKSDKCNECDKQFKAIVESMSKKYSGAIKGLADR